MILIGENINAMSKTIGQAFKERNAAPVQELTRAEAETGVLKTVKCQPLINSVSLQPDRFEPGLQLAKKYDADVIALLWGAEGMPRDANERAMNVVNFVYKANELGIPNEKLWIDPIVSPVSVEINQVKALVEFLSMLGEIAPGCKSTAGLSNISNGTPASLRPWLNRTYLMMMMKYDLYSAIVDAFDTDLIKLARGERPEIVSLVHRMMDGEKPDFSSLTEEEAKYAKTVRVLTGESLYSHSWLEI